MSKQKEAKVDKERVLTIQWHIVKVLGYFGIVFESDIHKPQIFNSVYEERAEAVLMAERMSVGMTETGLKVNFNPLSGVHFFVSDNQTERQRVGGRGTRWIHRDSLFPWPETLVEATRCQAPFEVC